MGAKVTISGDGQTMAPYAAHLLVVAKVLAECDGKDWGDLDGWIIDRYCRIAYLVTQAVRDADDAKR